MKTIAQQLKIKDFPFKIKDKEGRVIYSEYSHNFWCKREYDSNGNKIRYENSDGFWCKREYDSDNNEIRYENSNGFWVKREYGSDGNEIRYENSNGYIYYENSYGVVKDDRPKEIITLDGIKYKRIDQ